MTGKEEGRRRSASMGFCLSLPYSSAHATAASA